MHWRLDKYLIEESVNLIKRVFTYNKNWTNKDIEIVQFSSGSNISQNVFEQFFQSNERYPVITVSSIGGQFTNAALNDIIQVVDNDNVRLGERGTAIDRFDDQDKFAFALPPGIYNENLRGLKARFAWTGERLGNDNIVAILYSDYNNSKQQEASSSALGIDVCDTFIERYFEFYPQVNITKEADYWIELNSTEDSPYYILTDPSQGIYVINNGGAYAEKSGSAVGSLLLPAFIRIGGDYQGSLSIKISAKGETVSIYDISAIIAQYFTIAKHAQISRTEGSVDGTILNAISEFLRKGIYIRGIKKGNVEVRKRGGDDLENIFSITLTIDVFTEWFQDYPADTIQDINIDVATFFTKQEGM
jgi:hypothetical protein